MCRVLKDGFGLAAKNSIGYAKLSFRESLDARIEQFPELFSAEIGTGYQINDNCIFRYNQLIFFRIKIV